MPLRCIRATNEMASRRVRLGGRGSVS